jgi:hypothetical protein
MGKIKKKDKEEDTLPQTVNTSILPSFQAFTQSQLQKNFTFFFKNLSCTLPNAPKELSLIASTNGFDTM